MSAEQLATPKLRTRTLGAAIELDDTDRRLLNLMQGSSRSPPARMRTSRSSAASASRR